MPPPNPSKCDIFGAPPQILQSVIFFVPHPQSFKSYVFCEPPIFQSIIFRVTTPHPPYFIALYFSQASPMLLQFEMQNFTVQHLPIYKKRTRLFAFKNNNITSIKKPYYFTIHHFKILEKSSKFF